MIASIASTLDITIEGMSCSHCVAKVTKALQAVPGITVKSVVVGSASVELPSPTAAASVFAAIHAAGFTAPSFARRGTREDRVLRMLLDWVMISLREEAPVPSVKKPVRLAKAAECACEASSTHEGAHATQGRKAAGVEPELKSSNITRLKRAEGQVRGIVRMIEEDRYCPDVIIQIAAAQESLRAVAKNLLKNHLKHCARTAMKAGNAEADAMCDELVDVMSRLAK